MFPSLEPRPHSLNRTREPAHPFSASAILFGVRVRAGELGIRSTAAESRMSKLNLLAVELCVAARTMRFWRIVARNAEPVVGAFVFGWSAPLIVLFYLIETWLFFSLRASTEIAFEELRGKGAPTGKQLFAAAAMRFVVIAPLFGLIIFMFTAMAFVAVAVQLRWAEVTGAYFLVGVLTLAALLLIEVTDFG